MPLFDFADLDEENVENQFEPYKILTHPDGSFVELGRGAMGITYQAVDTTLQFPVALKVIDFGLAKMVGNQEPSDRISYDGFIGTPAFASPEQFSGSETDQRSDLFLFR